MMRRQTHTVKPVLSGNYDETSKTHTVKPVLLDNYDQWQNSYSQTCLIRQEANL